MWLNTFRYPYLQSVHGYVRIRYLKILHKVGNTYRFCVDDVANALNKAEDPEEEVLEEFQSRARTAFANIDDDV